MDAAQRVGHKGKIPTKERILGLLADPTLVEFERLPQDRLGGRVIVSLPIDAVAKPPVDFDQPLHVGQPTGVRAGQMLEVPARLVEKRNRPIIVAPGGIVIEESHVRQFEAKVVVVGRLGDQPAHDFRRALQSLRCFRDAPELREIHRARFEGVRQRLRNSKIAGMLDKQSIEQRHALSEGSLRLVTPQ